MGHPATVFMHSGPVFSERDESGELQAPSTADHSDVPRTGRQREN